MKPIRYKGITTGTLIGALFLDPVPAELRAHLKAAGLTWDYGTGWVAWANKCEAVRLFDALGATPVELVCVALDPDYAAA